MDLLNPDVWKAIAAILGAIVAIGGAIGTILKWGWTPFRWAYSKFRPAKPQEAPPAPATQARPPLARFRVCAGDKTRHPRFEIKVARDIASARVYIDFRYFTMGMGDYGLTEWKRAPIATLTAKTPGETVEAEILRPSTEHAHIWEWAAEPGAKTEPLIFGTWYQCCCAFVAPNYPVERAHFVIKTSESGGMPDVIGNEIITFSTDEETEVKSAT
jgi:hypothetical protein